MPRQYCFALLFACGFLTAQAQQGSFQKLPLDDLSAFRPQAGNWMIVGDVTMNPSVDVHHEETPPAQDNKKKKRSREQNPPLPKAVTYQQGNGILLNINDDQKKDQLITVMQHGDLELELEVMLPKGSNSGIYLQGRYEVQLLDSWGVKTPKFSDIGGIYRNWENEPGKAYAGKAPLANAAKAPGLWQKMYISFRAPRFDQAGKKIANARFVTVRLNGVVIHDNVEVPLPTGGPIENNETPVGPIVIQGDHGPVAFRNVRYKLMKELSYETSPVSYEVWHGNFSSPSDFLSTKPVLQGTNAELTAEVTDVENLYGLRLKGSLTIPVDGRYTLTSVYTGAGKLTVNNQELFFNPAGDSWRSDKGSIELKAGTYPYEFINYKTASWMPPRLALSIATEDTYPVNLHAIGSYPPSDNPTAPIHLEPGSSPRLHRGFVDFKGDRSRRLTHTIGVGDPAGVHYVYDMRSGNVVCAWKGGFVDATPMWHDRGDGSFRPLGAALYLFTDQPVAKLADQSAKFPEAAPEGNYIGRGYSIDAASGRPVFLSAYEGLELEHKIYPDDENRLLTQEIVVKKGQPENIYFKLAEGSDIKQLPDGTWAVDDHNYYIRVAAGTTPIVRDSNGKKELVAVLSQTLKYSIIW